MPRRAVFVVLLLALVLASCAPPPAAAQRENLVMITADPNATATPTPFQPVPATGMPSAPPAIEPTVTATLPPPTATPTNTPAPTSANPAPVGTPLTPTDRPKYLLFASLDYTRKRVNVDQLIAYTNHTGVPLNDLVLAVDTNMYSDCFALKSLTVNGSAASYTLDGISMTVTLPQSLAPGQALNLSLTYNLNLPARGIWDIFGYTSDQINLTDWYPFVVPYAAGQGWLIHKQWPYGEHLVYDEADFEVNLKQAEPGLGVTVAASSPGEASGDWTRYRMQSARAFVLSASPYFLVYQGSASGIPITSYYFAGDESAGEDVAQYAAKAVDTYSSLLAPYPYQGLSVVETTYADGMEFSGLIFLSRTFYSSYNGTAQSNLCDLGIHEVAHQWWFGLVASDQALEPWLDEALATYTEHLYYENNYPGLVNWWWGFRVNYYHPTGYVDTDVYNGGGFRPYVNAVYLNGANFLDELRIRIGDEAFLGFLRDYAAQMSHRRAAKQDFFNILYQHATVDYSDIVNSYFQYP